MKLDPERFVMENRCGMIDVLDRMPWLILVVLCLTLGLAPFTPPHIWEKLQMLFQGKLVRPIDWFDFLLHGTPWLLLIAKAIVTLTSGNKA